MNEQLETSTKSEYTSNTPSMPVSSLGLLLHQFFLDRMSHCVQAKHAHLLRWRRFAEHSSSIEDAYPAFKSRLAYIMSEFADCRERSSRLSQARDCLLSFGSLSNPQAIVPTSNAEDVEIYIRWFISHVYSQKSFLNAMKSIEWTGYMMSIDAKASGSLDGIYDDDSDDEIDQTGPATSVILNNEDSATV